MDEFVVVDGELVGIPSVLVVATVGVNGTQHACVYGASQFVFERVPGQCGMVHLDVHLEVLLQAVCTQETDNRFRVHIVLVLGRLHRFRLDEERAFEAFGAGVVAGGLQHLCQMFLFTLHVGVQQAHVAFASAPEHVVASTQFDGGVDGILDLYGCACHHVEIRVGGRTVHIAFVSEYIGRTPKVLDARGLHLFLDISHDGLHVGFIFLDGIAFGDEVHVVEAEIFDTQFLHDFKTGVSLLFGNGQGIGALVPGERLRAAAELVAAFCAKGVPPSHGKFQPVFHLLTHDDLFGIIIAVCQWVFALFSFEFNLSDTRKILFLCHNFLRLK